MKLNWQDAPTQTQWGHDMVVATVALGKDHSVDMYCERSKTAEAEALLKKPWVSLTHKEVADIVVYPMNPTADFVRTIEAKLREKNT
jgi:hypothetical protein